MKIIIGTSRPFHLFHLARELAEKGHEVKIIGYMPAYKMKAYDCGKAKYVSFYWFLFPIAILALQRRFTIIQRWATFFIMPLIDLCICLSMEKCDFFIGLSGVNLQSFKVAKKKYKAITICDRGSSHVVKQEELIKASSLPSIYIDRELKGYELADFIMVPSIFSFNSFIEKGVSKQKILVNNYGVNLDRFKKHIEHNLVQKKQCSKINALFIGGWTYQKGVDIISSVLEEESCLLVSHIGNVGDVKEPHERYIKMGHVPNRELGKQLSKFDVLLLPSRQDGFGMVLLEALACGVPVIASKNTGAPDVKTNIKDGDNVILMDSVSATGLKGALNRYKQKTYSRSELLSDDDKQYFSWSAYGSRYNSILKAIANG